MNGRFPSFDVDQRALAARADLEVFGNLIATTFGLGDRKLDTREVLLQPRSIAIIQPTGSDWSVAIPLSRGTWQPFAEWSQESLHRVLMALPRHELIDCWISGAAGSAKLKAYQVVESSRSDAESEKSNAAAQDVPTVIVAIDLTEGREIREHVQRLRVDLTCMEIPTQRAGRTFYLRDFLEELELECEQAVYTAE